ncbi:MAG: tetratricopeptide repeat protein [Saprospiraceae bacterium]|nr:tetratricopeptide repeat protein [Saprospiraceae bacterium]
MRGIFLLIILIVSCKNKETPSPETLVQLSDSIPYFDELLKKFPDSDSLHYNKGIYLIQNEQVDSGIIMLEKALELNPGHANYYLSLSDAYILAIESKKAEAIIDSAMDRFPNDVIVLLKKSRVQLILNKHLNAMATLDFIFSIDPQNAEANYIAGHVFYEQGDTGRAIKCYQKTVDLNPEYVEGWIQLGDIMMSMKNKRALDYYRNAIRLDSNNIETLHNYAYALQSLGNKNLAIEAYKKNIIKSPNYELSYYNLGLMYQEMDSCFQAIQYLDKAIELNKEEASSYYFRARCFIQSGRQVKAREDLKEALRIYPNYKEADELLKKI